MWVKYNPNPYGINVGDCAVRAVAKALSVSWADAYLELTAVGLTMGDMPSANRVWGKVLKNHGFTRQLLNESAAYTVSDFCVDRPHGVFVVALENHVVCVTNGDTFDTWDSTNEIPIYYWQMNEN